jgi:hypothetical protein
MNNDTVKLLPPDVKLPAGWYWAYDDIPNTKTLTLRRPDGTSGCAVTWVHIAEEMAAAMNAPTPREQELMALVEECERVIAYFSQFTIIKAKTNSLGVTYSSDGEHARKALAAIQKAKENK